MFAAAGIKCGSSSSGADGLLPCVGRPSTRLRTRRELIPSCGWQTLEVNPANLWAWSGKDEFIPTCLLSRVTRSLHTQVGERINARFNRKLSRSYPLGLQVWRLD